MVPSTAASIEEKDDLIDFWESLMFLSELCEEQHYSFLIVGVKRWISHDFLSYIIGPAIVAYVIWG